MYLRTVDKHARFGAHRSSSGTLPFIHKLSFRAESLEKSHSSCFCCEKVRCILNLYIFFAVFVFDFVFETIVKFTSSGMNRTHSSSDLFTALIQINQPNIPHSRQYSSAVKNFRAILQQQIDGIHDAGTYKNERIISTPQKTVIRIKGKSRDLINFCANNYLGLSVSHLFLLTAKEITFNLLRLIALQCNAEIIDYSKQVLDEYGSGLSSVRFICGTQTIHKELEDKLSKFHGREDTILYASCFDANAGIFEVILTPEDAIFSDELNHASIIDGIRLCKAKKYRYRHRDMNGKQNPIHFVCCENSFLIFSFRARGAVALIRCSS